MPKVDMDMTTGQVTKWYAGDGDLVEKGSCLFEIETDKTAMEVEAPADGVLRDISGMQGVDIPVGQVIGWIFAEGEIYVRQTSNLGLAKTAEAPASSALTKRAARTANDVAADSAGSADRAVRASPLARRMAKTAKLNLATVAGSGPRGRIQQADVARFLADQAPSKSAPAQAPVSAGAPNDGAIRNLFEPGLYDLVPHDSMRKTIARRLVESKRFVPHFYLVAECKIDQLLSLRQEINESARLIETQDYVGPAFKVSVNDMIIKAMARALRDVPDTNVSWTESSMIKHDHVDVGVAVSIPGGLVTPIVRRAEEKSLTAISKETKDLAERARSRKLEASEYRGGTTAISNLGMFGTREFSAIINPPHATILAVGAGERRPVILEDGETVAAATVMTITLSTDHRAVDGALAAELLEAVKSRIENPISLLV